MTPKTQNSCNPGVSLEATGSIMSKWEGKLKSIEQIISLCFKQRKNF